MRFHLRTIGCRLNQSEIDAMARQLRQQGHDIVEDPAHADQLVVNTCAVTADASRTSRMLIRELHRAAPEGRITVTGCYAQLEPAIMEALPGVDAVVDNRAKDRLVELVTGEAVEPFDLEPITRGQFPGAQGRTRAFVKAQDGCDNACTFCVTTIARGQGRSRPHDEIVREIASLHASGYQEAVLTGVHLGSYGHDRGERDGLTRLVQAILQETAVPRLRLSSLEPWDLSPDFFALWRDSRLCRHLHLPLQSGCDATLRRMLRRTSQQQFSDLVQAAREQAPAIGITTDVIVGFPGETDEEFGISLDFIQRMAFAGIHVFRYSRRPATAAARMRGQVSEDVKKQRSQQVLALAETSARRFAGRFAGQTAEVLWEHITGASEEGFMNVGYTDHYIRVHTVYPRVLTGMITTAKLICLEGDRMLAEPQMSGSDGSYSGNDGMSGEMLSHHE